MKLLQVNAGEYLNDDVYTNYNEAYNLLIKYINELKDPNDIIIYDREHLHIQIKLNNKNNYMELPCVPSTLIG